MEVTLREAAHALSCSSRPLLRAFGLNDSAHGDTRSPRVDTEELSALLEMDHRFMMAFLTGYDVALGAHAVAHMRGVVRSSIERDPRFIPALPSRLGVRVLRRYSLRRVAQIIDAEERARGKLNKSPRLGGGTLLPPPDTLPFDTWTYESEITRKGNRIASGRRSLLTNGTASALPILKRAVEKD